MFVTKDPNKAFINLGKLGLTASVPEDELTEEQKKRRTMSGSMQDPPKMKSGGSVKSSASKRADGIAKKGKTRGKMV
jgi:hypothetical protein